MNDKEKDILITNRVKLVDILNMRDGLYSQLISKRVLNQRMIRTIQHDKTLDRQAEELLDILPTRGPNAFKHFCEALHADDQGHIVDEFLKIEDADGEEVDSFLPENISILEKGGTCYQINILSKKSCQKKKSHSFINAESKKFENHPFRYVLKHYTSDSCPPDLHSNVKQSPVQETMPPQIARWDSMDTMTKRRQAPLEPAEELPSKISREEIDEDEKSETEDEEIDLSDGPVMVDVEHCTRQFFTSHHKKSYQMSRIPRGKAIIINVNKVEGKRPRKGSEIDQQNLKNLFLQLDFDVLEHTDKSFTAENIAEEMRKFAALEAHKDADCTIICLLSHGEEGVIYGSDGKQVLLENIYSLFDNNNCKHLQGKPKIFFIQGCRGDLLDSGVQCSSEDELDGVTKIPTRSDMLFCYPTQKGYYAWRNCEQGSWYIEALVKVLMKYSKNEDICTMLNRVNRVVSRKVSKSTSIDSCKMLQMSEYRSTLIKPHFYFFPGIGSL